MKVLDKSKLQAGMQTDENVPVVRAVPLPVRKPEPVRAEVIPVRREVSSADAAVILFLRQFRVLLGAARLYQRNHPRLMEILASTEQQLRIALAARSPLVVAVERTGMLLPRQEGNASELLHDPRGELRGLAEELLRSGICSLLFTIPINVGELDSLAHEISLVPRSSTPGDTTSRKLWNNWIRERMIAGIRINIPTERRDSLMLASLMSAVLTYDNAERQSDRSRDARAMPHSSFEQVAATLRVLTKLVPPHDPEMQPSAEDIARRFHSVVSGSDPFAISLIVHEVSLVKPREGETLEPYIERLTDALVLSFVKQEFDAGRAAPPAVLPLLVRLDQERDRANKSISKGFGGSQHDEIRVAGLCEKFWNALPARVIARTLRSADAWCVPASAVARFLDPLAEAAENRKADRAGSEGRAALISYARCLESEESKPRRAVAAGLAEIVPQLERLWPHASMADFGPVIVRAFLAENSPGIAGMLSAAIENLARIALLKREYGEFEQILELLEAAPRDDKYIHVSALVGRILNDEQWLYLVDEGLTGQPLSPVIPRLLKKRPDRLIDRLGLLLTADDGLNSLPAMVRLIHGTGEPVIGALETRLFEARRMRVVTAIHLLASSEPKRLAVALPKALASWEWSLQDLAVTELMKWTNPSVIAATSQAFLATLGDAHAMVVPCMIDHLGIAQSSAAAPQLLQIAVGEHATLRDMYFRIKAVEALGRMRVLEAAPALQKIVRLRSGLAHDEPAALRSVAEEALSLIENHPSSERARVAEGMRAKSSGPNSRPRRYLRARMQPPMQATMTGSREGAVRVRILALGGAFLETDQRLLIGDSLQLEIRAGLRKIQSTAVVRNITPSGAGIEFVHMKPEDRERLRRLITQLVN